MMVLRAYLVFCFILIGRLGFCADLSGTECNYEKSKQQFHTENHFLMQQAVESNCPELMDAILKKERPGDIYSAILDYTRDTLGVIAMQLEMLKGVAADDPAYIRLKSQSDIMGKVSNYLKEKCPDKTKDSDACNARKTNEDFAAKIMAKANAVDAQEQAEAKEVEQRDSPQGLIDQACACDKFIGLNQSDIDREKEVGKISGTVNMMVLNSAGNHIVDIKKMKKDIAAKYRSVTKKDLKNYKCANVETLTNPLLWRQGVAVREDQ